MASRFKAKFLFIFYFFLGKIACLVYGINKLQGKKKRKKELEFGQMHRWGCRVSQIACVM